MAGGEAAGPRPRRRIPLLRLLLTLAFVLLVAWTVHRLGPRRVIAVAREADATWLALSAVPLAARFLVWGVKWRRVLERRAQVPFDVALRTLMAGTFVNLTTPTAKLGGGVLRALLIERRYAWGAAASYGRVLCDQVGTTLGAFGVFGVLALVLGVVGGAPARGAFAVAGVIALGSLAAALALRRRAWNWVRGPAAERFARRSLPGRLLRLDEDRTLADTIRDLGFPLLGEGRALTTLGSDMLLGAISFALLCFSNVLVLRALGVEADLWLVGAAVVVGYFAGSIIGAWGGIGVTEVTLAALYVRIGVPVETATASALLHRTTFYLFVLVFGGIALALERRIIEGRER